MRNALPLLLMAIPVAAETPLPPAAKTKVDFIQHVEPILRERCHSCHGDSAQQAGLRLDRRQQAMRGGDYGPVILPGRGAESKLIKRLVSGDGGMQMPPTGALSDEEIGVLRAWIDQGADWRIEVKPEAPHKPVDPRVQSLISAVRNNDRRSLSETFAASPEMVNAADASGSTLLHHAAAFGSVETLRFLLEKGANAGAVNQRKSTPLHWAVHDQMKVRALLDAGAPADAKQVEGRTPLYHAVTIPNGADVARLLIEKGAAVDSRLANGATPLMAAANRGDLVMMKLLLDRGADVNARVGNGATPLMAAATSGQASAVRLLLDRGAKVNLTTKKGDTALMDAAVSGTSESVRMLLESGADVNARGERGYTALMYAAASEKQNVTSVKMLLDKGADQAPEADGDTARSLAAKRGDSAIARLLGVSEEERRRGGVPAALNNTPKPIPQAVGSALAMLEKQSHNFIRIGGCNSCHAQDLPSAAAGIARQRGLPAPASIAQLPNSMRGATAERLLDLTGFGVSSIGWELLDYGMNGVSANEYTDAVVRFIKSMQTAAGNWRATTGKRPPMGAGEPLAAALAIYSLQTYAPAAEQADTREAVTRAVRWLADSAELATTQDHAFQVMGLAWGKASPAAIERGAKALAALQRADGGWGQMPTMGTDAHATGQALYALHLAGMAPSDAVYRKGVAYLLRNQAADGSWHVKTRSIWLQPYFESGFPYGHDQWISAAGTAWASMALAVTQEVVKVSQR